MTKNIVFVDSRVAGYQVLIASLPADTEWVLLEADKDGLLQMQAALAGYENLDSIQIVSHGSVGTLYLGSTVLDSGNMLDYQHELQAIGSSLTATGDILLYGCNVAQGSAGQEFVTQFATATGADVAASNDITGASLLGGDTGLEVVSGDISSTPFLTQAIANDAQILLATSISNGFRHPLGNGILTEATDGDGYYVPNAQQVYDGGNYGARYSPELPLSFHLGEDWNAEDGTDLGDPVYAISNGYVTQAGTFTGASSLGNYVVIRHDLPPGSEIYADGAWRTEIVSLYAHLNSFSVAVGDIVTIGQQIGEVGSSGTTASHLHFEIRLGTEYSDITGYADDGVDPEGWVDPTDFINAHRSITPTAVALPVITVADAVVGEGDGYVDWWCA